MSKKLATLTMFQYNAQIQAAYAALDAAHDAEYHARRAEADSKNRLDDAVNAVVRKYAADPQGLGKNEEQRKARVAELTADERTVHAAAQRTVVDSAFRTGKAFREVSRIRDTLDLIGIFRGRTRQVGATG